MFPIARALVAASLGILFPLSLAFAQNPGEVLWHQKITAGAGGGPLGIRKNDQFGRGAAAIGDLDGDGICDLAVGALGDDDGQGSDALDYGACWILFMNRDATCKSYREISRTSAGLPLDPGDEFGRTVRELGDFDLDGVPDIMVGADKDDDNGTDKGAFYLLFLNRDGTVKSWRKVSETSGGFRGDLDPYDLFGRGLRVLGDLDLDGVPDIGAGAVWDDDGGTNRGAYWILFMRRDGTVKAWNKLSDWYGNVDSSLSSSGEFGFDCVVLGDRNGDGIQDIAVCSPDQKTDGNQQGAVFVFYMNRDGSAKDEFRIAENYAGFVGDMLDYNDEFGCSIDSIGDVDGDGVQDIVVGAGKDDDGPTGSFDRGAVYMLFLKPDASVKGWQKISRTSGRFYGAIDDADRFGTSLASPGDLNLDGVGDVFVGIRFADAAGSGSGAEFFLAFNNGTFVPPVARFDFTPSVGRAPLTAQFTDTSTGDITGWEWDFGDGTISNERSPSHTYTTTAVRSVSLTVRGPAGSDQRLRTRIIKVNPPLKPKADFAAGATFGMAPLVVEFDDRSTGLINGWSWDFGDGATSTEPEPVHAYAAAGNYTVRLTVQNVAGTSTLERANLVTVTDVPPPFADFSASETSGMAPLAVQFEDQTIGDVTSWKWDFGDGATSVESDPLHTYVTPGTFTVSLLARGPGGSSTRTRDGLVQVDVPPPPEAAFAADVTSGIDPLLVNFTNLTSGLATTWAWSFGDGAVSSEPEPSHLYLQAGRYTVSLVATGPGGSSESTAVDLVEVVTVVRGIADGSFEEQAADGLPQTPWTVTNGANHVVRASGEDTLPSAGLQWLLLSTRGTQFTSPPTNPGGETLPALGGAGVEQHIYLEDPLTVLHFDAAFALGGPAADPLDNDWMSVDVSDGISTVNLFYADGASALPAASASTGLPRTAIQHVSADLLALFPTAVRNTRFTLTLQAGNGGDDESDSFGLVDGLRLDQRLGSALRTGCDESIRNSLRVLSGSPRLGTSMTFGVDNPLGTQGPSSRAYLWMSKGPSPSPCGTAVPSFGMSGPGAAGMVLVDRTAGVLIKTVTGGLWNTPGTPASVPLAMPAAISWIGLPVYVQGYLVDTRLTYGVRTGVTDGFKLLIGP